MHRIKAIFKLGLKWRWGDEGAMCLAGERGQREGRCVWATKVRVSSAPT